MTIRISQRRIKELSFECGVLSYPTWANTDRPVESGDIAHAIKTKFFLAPDDARDPNLYMTAETHAARIAWLIKHTDLKRLTITICGGRIADGNHRFAACLYSGMEYINCVLIQSASEEQVKAA
jgi:hypothetical protein